MSEIRKFPTEAERVESGPIQFGDDWPGVFLRGDHAHCYAAHLKQVLDGSVDPITAAVVRGLLRDLRSAHVRG